MTLRLGLARGGGVQPGRARPVSAAAEFLSGFEIGALHVGDPVEVWSHKARHAGTVLETNRAQGVALVEYFLRSGARRVEWLGRGLLLRRVA